MSWAKDEWKQELPPQALQKIGDMEKEYENLNKLRQQQDLKIDSYVTALEKGKMELEEERSSAADLQKEVRELTLKVTTLEAREERYINEIKNKEKAVEYGEELLEKAKQKLKVENAKVMELEKSLEQRSSEAEKYAERSDKMEVEIGNLKQEKAHLSKENDNYKERLGALTKELQTLRQIMSENEQKAMEVAQENEKDNDESCPQEPTPTSHHSDPFLDILKKENKSLVRELEQLKSQREQMKHIIDEKTHEVEKGVTKVAELRSELQDARRELKTTKGKVSKLETAVENREREITNLKEKVTKYKTNEEKMKEEIQMLIWKDQLKDQSDDLVEGSKRLETADAKPGPANESKTSATEDKLCQQLSKENDSLQEQITCLRDTNSALVESMKDKDERLKLYYDEKQEQIKKEEARLERVENLLVENARLKERVQDLEDEAKASSLGTVNICVKCKQEIMSNEKPGQVNSAVDKKERSSDSEDDADEKMVTEANVCTKPVPVVIDCTADIAMYVNMEVDESPQDDDKTMQDADDVTSHADSNKDADDDHDNDDDADNDDDDAISCDTYENDSSLQRTVLQVLLSLSTVQMEHEMVQRGVSKCYSTVKRIMQLVNSQVSDTDNQDNMSKLQSDVERLSSQLKAVKGIEQRCATSIKSQIESIAGYLEIIKESDTEFQDEQKDSRSPGRKLSWDNFESERAFRVFKATVDPLIKQIEDEGEDADTLDKECGSLQTVTNKPSSLRQGSQADEQNIDRADSGPECKPSVTENALQLDDFVDVLRTLMDENNDLLSERMETLLQQFETKMMNHIAAMAIQKVQQSKQDVPTSSENSDSEEDTSSVNPRKEEKQVIEELEMMKRKISGVQKLVKHLMSSIESTKQEKEEADSHIDLLTAQMRNISSHHEIRYTELERNLRTTSERELTLQQQIIDLQTEKEDISCNYKESIEDLKQKEHDLARLSHEIKNIQAKSKESEQKLKNKIEELQAEREDISCNYRESFENLKKKEHELVRLSHEIKNIQAKSKENEQKLKNKIEVLQAEKEEMNCHYEESFKKLREKEHEVARLSQEIKNIQTKSKENEQKLKSKIEVLQAEKTCIWHDYTEASREARERKDEIEALVAKMKKTEVALMSLFNTMGNIDDFLQRAKEMNLFQ